MPFYCHLEDCQNWSVRVHGDCMICQRRLCSAHLKKPGHRCATPDEDTYESAVFEAQKTEIGALLSRISLTGLAGCASRIRNHIHCTVTPPEIDALSGAMGNVNLHLEIQFDDGVRWIARIKRQNVTTPSESVQELVIRSEVATYRFLEATRVPAPRVFGFCAIANNPVHTPYILMEKITGKPYSKCTPNEQQKQHVRIQLAAIYKELYRYPFDKIGSLHLNTGISQLHVGSLASELLSEIDSEDTIRTLGPFENLQQYYQQTITRKLAMIGNGELYAPWAVDTYLIYLHLLDLTETQQRFCVEDPKFYLKHPDDQGSHIMVNDDFEITGLIDWEWAYTAPAQIALASPMMLWDVGAFFDGRTGLSKEETEFACLLDEQYSMDQGLGKYVRDGKTLQRLNFILSNEIFDWDISSFINIFGALLAKPVTAWNWDSWKKEQLEKHQQDETLRRLIHRSKLA